MYRVLIILQWVENVKIIYPSFKKDSI